MAKDSQVTTRTITTLFAVGLMTIAPLWRAHAGHVTETTVAPVSITNQVGSYSGSINAFELVRERLAGSTSFEN
jgi:hypothetical protein